MVRRWKKDDGERATRSIVGYVIQDIVSIGRAADITFVGVSVGVSQGPSGQFLLLAYDVCYDPPVESAILLNGRPPFVGLVVFLLFLLFYCTDWLRASRMS